jgi:hypothetical protein
MDDYDRVFQQNRPTSDIQSLMFAGHLGRQELSTESGVVQTYLILIKE